MGKQIVRLLSENPWGFGGALFLLGTSIWMVNDCADPECLVTWVGMIGVAIVFLICDVAVGLWSEKVVAIMMRIGRGRR